MATPRDFTPGFNTKSAADAEEARLRKETGHIADCLQLGVKLHKDLELSVGEKLLANRETTPPRSKF